MAAKENKQKQANKSPGKEEISKNNLAQTDHMLEAANCIFPVF